MIRQYFKYGIRSLKKDKKSSIFLIFGLSISLIAVILIALWVTDELTFNGKFSKSDRIYQLAASFDDKSNQYTYSSPAPIATFALDQIPSIEEICRIQKSTTTSFVSGTNQFNETGFFADPSFFKIFGNTTESSNKNILSSINSIVLTKSMADKLFPNENAIGKTIQLELDWILKSGKEAFVISAVLDDFSENSSLKGSFILPFSLLKKIKGDNYDSEWGNFQNNTFVLLKKGANPEHIAQQFSNIQKQKFGTNDGSGNEGLYKNFEYYLQNIQSLNLYNPKGEQQGVLLVYSILGLGIVILAISCANYINLITAKATKRGKEISLRKVIGASKKHLFFQYITESGILFLVSLIIAVVFTYLLLPFFNDLTDKKLAIDLFSHEIYLIGTITFFSTLLLAGIYPAILFSSNKLIQLIKSDSNPLGNQVKVRKGLVILQFTCTIILITGTIVFQKQIDFMRNKDLGYNKENVFLFEQKNFLPHYDAIRNELEKQPGILGVTAASSDLTNFGSETADIGWEGKSIEQTNFFITQVAVDRNFTKVMDISFKNGNGFTGTAADSSHVLLNEKAVQEMGIKDPIGKSIEFQGRKMTIVGIMKNFNFNDLKTEIKPCAFFLGNGESLGGMYVRAESNKIDQAISSVQNMWNKYNPEYELGYNFLDESFNKLYKKDLVSAKLISIFSILAIVLSCMGLTSLIIYSTELKVKEIGIRKTLGASVSSIILLITKEYISLIILSILIAFPLTWIIASQWLANYVYKTSLDWWIFLISGVSIICLAILSAGRISIKAAKANPINALRNDN